MDIKRTVLWVIFFMSAVMLFDNWQRDHGRPSMFFPSANPTKTVGSAEPGSSTPGTQSADLPATNGYPKTIVFHANDWMTVVDMGPRGGRRTLGGNDEVHRGVGEILTTPAFTSVAGRRLRSS